jgi:hypothetical protein
VSHADFQQARALGFDHSVASLMICAAYRAAGNNDEASQTLARQLNETFPELPFADEGAYEFGAAQFIGDATPAALLMAAYWQADTANRRRLHDVVPDLCVEAADRWEAPGGRLDGDA